MKKSLLLACGLLMYVLCYGKVEHLLPMPQQIMVHAKEKPFRLGKGVRLYDPTFTWLLQDFLEKHGGMKRRSTGKRKPRKV